MLYYVEVPIVSNDMIVWLSECIGPEMEKWFVESEYTPVVDDISHTILFDCVVFRHKNDELLFRLKWT